MMIPTEPPVGTWVRDRHGAVSVRHGSGGWAPPGCEPFAQWDKMWEARGPLAVCGPWGSDPAPTRGDIAGELDVIRSRMHSRYCDTDDTIKSIVYGEISSVLEDIVAVLRTQ